MNSSTEKKKPEDDKNKLGVDRFDQMAWLYPTKSAINISKIARSCLKEHFRHCWHQLPRYLRESCSSMDCVTRRQFALMLVDLLVSKQPIDSNDDTQLRENDKADLRRS